MQSGKLGRSDGKSSKKKFEIVVFYIRVLVTKLVFASMNWPSFSKDKSLNGQGIQLKVPIEIWKVIW